MVNKLRKNNIDVVVHIFQSELRDYYRLEDLWADAPMVEYNDEV